METNIDNRRLKLLLMLLVLVSFPVFSQKQFLERDKSYAVAKIYEKGKPAVAVKNLVLTADTVLRYDLSGYGTVSGGQTRGINNIRYIGVKTGTHAGIYGAYGAASGLLGSVIGVLQVKADPTLDDSGVDWAPFILGFTAGGAVIGAVVALRTQMENVVPTRQLYRLLRGFNACLKQEFYRHRHKGKLLNQSKTLM